MKPLTLKISAFGPFKDEIEIDFSSISDSKIFLITGDTGSGKTSIFDAICYCLYNVSSGTNKNFTLSALISNLTASPKSISIEFTFFINSLFLNLVSSTFCISSFNLLE